MDSRIFFGDWDESDSDRRIREGEASQICKSCPVKASCLEYAEKYLEFGFAGGKNERERSKQRKHYVREQKSIEFERYSANDWAGIIELPGEPRGEESQDW